GDPASADLIEGPAVDFARVVTQTRNVADTALRVSGPVATRWMASAQCFAGGREAPPAPGSRYVAS
ncbi:MAG: TIGR03084 family protein, partial [Pseudodonghicola sp.]